MPSRSTTRPEEENKPEVFPIEISVTEKMISLSLFDWLRFYFGKSLTGRYYNPVDYAVQHERSYSINFAFNYKK